MVSEVTKPLSTDGSMKPMHADTESASTFITVYGARIYMYSAIVRNSSAFNHTSQDSVIINGWEHLSAADSGLTCCLMLGLGRVQRTAMIYRNYFHMTAKLRSVQYWCDVDNALDLDINIHVSLAVGNDSCPVDGRYYQKLHYPRMQNTPAFAICSKLAYGSLDGGKLLEWFEVQRYLGVSKILAYTYNINDEARRVFDYYTSIGLAEILDYDVPLIDGETRDLAVKRPQQFNDDHVTVFDCQERLRGYKYAMVMDTDEYMLPNGTRNLVELAESVFQSNDGNLAAVMFRTRIHATSWLPTNRSSWTYLGRYGNSTAAIVDRHKTMYVTSRVKPGSVHTHGLKPLHEYRRKTIQPEVAVLHHFRSCRVEWMRNRTLDKVQGQNRFSMMNKFPTVCQDFIQFPANEMMRLVAVLEDRILKLRVKLHIHFHT